MNIIEFKAKNWKSINKFIVLTSKTNVYTFIIKSNENEHKKSKSSINFTNKKEQFFDTIMREQYKNIPTL